MIGSDAEWLGLIQWFPFAEPELSVSRLNGYENRWERFADAEKKWTELESQTEPLIS